MKQAEKLGMAPTIKAVLCVKAALYSWQPKTSARDPGVTLHDDKEPGVCVPTVLVGTNKEGNECTRPELHQISKQMEQGINLPKRAKGLNQACVKPTTLEPVQDEHNGEDRANFTKR